MPEPLVSVDGYECATCGHEWMADIDDGKSGGIKVGTKVKSIRLIPGDHPIDGKVDGRGVLIMADKVKKA